MWIGLWESGLLPVVLMFSFLFSTHESITQPKPGYSLIWGSSLETSYGSSVDRLNIDLYYIWVNAIPFDQVKSILQLDPLPYSKLYPQPSLPHLRIQNTMAFLHRMDSRIEWTCLLTMHLVDLASITDCASMLVDCIEGFVLMLDTN